jgi:hypothetical protein
MELLEGRAEAMSGEFKPQGVANTLWAYATLGMQPGDGLLGKLEEQTERLAHEFNSQDVANTLWTISFFSIHNPDLGCRFVCALSSKLSVLDASCFEGQELSQMHQIFTSCDLEEGVRARMPGSFATLKDKLGPACKAAFVAQCTKASASQEQVSDALRGMGLWVEDEFRCTKSGYSIDMRVWGSISQDVANTCGAGWAVEFDGPSHFLACRAATGATLMKRRHLELLGYTVVSVPFWVSCRPRRGGMATLLLFDAETAACL